jgi:hypothetical protein
MRRDVLAVIGWSLFWTAVILGVAALILEWQVLERVTGL